MKFEGDKLDVNELVNVSIGLNDLKRKLVGLDVGKSKAVPKDLKNIINVVDKEVVKKTVYSTLNSKVKKSKKSLTHLL